MAKLAYVNTKGEVEFLEDDAGQQLVSLPGPLEAVPLDELRFNGTAVVDAKLESDFFIDDSGEKWLLNDAPNAAEVSGTFDLNRRGGPNDAIQRTTGSWILDGFTVDSFVTVRGSAGADLVYKVIAVSALDLEFDESFERIPADELGVSITVSQGWQKVPVSFNDVMLLDGEKWRAKTDNENQDDAVDVFRVAVNALAAQWVTTQSPYPDRHRNPPEYELAKSKILKAGRNETPPYMEEDLAERVVNEGGDIYDQLTVSETREVTFVNSGKEITPSTGDFSSYPSGSSLTIEGSASNDSDRYKVINISNGATPALRLGTSGPNLTDEGPVTVTLTAVSTVSGFAERANERNPGFSPKEQWTRFMEEAVAINWFGDVETIRKDYIKDARQSTIWATTTVYAVDDIVFEPESRLFYRCNTAHTATDFGSDLANWDAYLPDGVTYPVYPTAQIET